MTNSMTLTFICLAVALSTSCNKSSTQPSSQEASAPAAKHYHLKGKVVSVDKQSKMANIDSDAIPGYMDAMTMPYVVKPESELDKLKPGEPITADLIVQDESAWLENIVIANPPATEKK